MMDEYNGGGSCPWEYDSAYNKYLEEKRDSAPSDPTATPSEYEVDPYTCEPEI